MKGRKYGMETPGFVKRVVKTCLKIGEDDKVTIFAWRHMIDMAEAFAIECRKAGAHTHIEIGSDEIFYDKMLNLPLEYIEKTDPFSLALMDVATANIFISGPENPERMLEVPAERWGAVHRADKPFFEKFLGRKIRSAEITLGYVTQQRAKTYGFNYEEWLQNLKEALDVEYTYLQQLGKKLGNILEKTNDVRVTSDIGTDFSFSLEERPIHIYDGVIDDEDVEKGAIFIGLPSGTVSFAPAENSANGTLISDLTEPYAGLLIHSLHWVFKDGILKSFDGSKNIEALRAGWEKATGDKDRIGWFTFGINPKAKTGFINNSIVLGTATVGIGDNRELGGKNECDWSFNLTMTKPTVELDGKQIMKNGDLLL